MSATQDALREAYQQRPDMEFDPSTVTSAFWSIRPHSPYGDSRRTCRSCGMVLIYPIRDSRLQLCMDCAEVALAEHEESRIA